MKNVQNDPEAYDIKGARPITRDEIQQMFAQYTNSPSKIHSTSAITREMSGRGVCNRLQKWTTNYLARTSRGMS